MEKGRIRETKREGEGWRGEDVRQSTTFLAGWREKGSPVLKQHESGSRTRLWVLTIREWEREGGDEFGVGV